jgi:hypothetical protein
MSALPPKADMMSAISMSALGQKWTFRSVPEARALRRGAVRGAVNFPFWLSGISPGLLCSKTIEQPVTTGAAQIVLAAAAVRSS